MQSRRRFLRSAGVLSGMAATFPVWADTYIDLDLPGGPQPAEPNWNGGGFMRNVIESVQLKVA